MEWLYANVELVQWLQHWVSRSIHTSAADEQDGQVLHAARIMLQCLGIEEVYEEKNESEDEPRTQGQVRREVNEAVSK